MRNESFFNGLYWAASICKVCFLRMSAVLGHRSNGRFGLDADVGRKIANDPYADGAGAIPTGHSGFRRRKSRGLTNACVMFPLGRTYVATFSGNGQI